jgi:hypothetical protein
MDFYSLWFPSLLCRQRLPMQVPRNCFPNFPTIFSIVSPKTPRKQIRKNFYFLISQCTLFGYGRKRPVGTYRGSCHAQTFLFIQILTWFFNTEYIYWRTNRIRKENTSNPSPTSPPPRPPPKETIMYILMFFFIYSNLDLIFLHRPHILI